MFELLNMNKLSTVLAFLTFINISIWAQNDFQRNIKIEILPFKFISNDSSLNMIGVDFQNTLFETLNRKSNFTAEILPDSNLEKAQLNISSPVGIDGFISLSVLKQLKKLKLADCDYFLECVMSLHDGFIYYNCSVLIDSSLKEIFTISDKASLGDLINDRDNFINNLVQRTLSNLVINFTKNIRIAMVDFEMTGGDSSNYLLFEKSLPYMLATDIGVSPHITILEIGKTDTLFKTILKSETASGIYDQNTALKLGHTLLANYLIMGAYWEWNNQIRVDIRCVNIETGESTIMKAIEIDEINMSNISEKMEKIASDIRFAIGQERDPSRLIPTIAVTGYPPVPNDKDTYAILLNLIKATSKKLKLIKGIDVKEYPDKVLEYLSSRHDRWEMGFELNSDILVSFQIDRLDPENVIISCDLFDSNNPQGILYSDSRRIRKSKLNKEVELLIDSLISKVAELLVPKKDNAGLDNDLWNQIHQIEYYGLSYKYGVAFRVGPIVRTDSHLFLDQELGLSFELSFLWLPLPSSKIQIEPLSLRIDFLNTTSDKKVIGMDWFAIAKYKIEPYATWNYFFGGGIGILGAGFVAPGDFVFDSDLGIALLTGIEPYLGNSWHMNFELKWTTGFSKFKSRDVKGLHYNGGRLGGLQFTVGLEYSW